jgi:hypothetical protein
MPAGGGVWATIASGNAPVVNGLLGTWNAMALPEGYYVLRLTGWNACQVASTAIQIVWLDRQMDSTQLRSPTAGQVVGGMVCADGTAWDHCSGTFSLEHRAGSGGFIPFDSVNPPWILNDPLGAWNTRSGTPDGLYAIRLSATDGCGNPDTESVSIEVDNTSPIALITSPVQCSLVDGSVQIRGMVNDAHLGSWTLAYTGGPANGWVTIASGTTPVINGVLGTWNAAALPDCAYTLRLIATDRAVIDCNGALHNQAEYDVSVRIGSATPCPEDIDDDGDVDLSDLTLLLSRFGTICP